MVPQEMDKILEELHPATCSSIAYLDYLHKLEYECPKDVSLLFYCIVLAFFRMLLEESAQSHLGVVLSLNLCQIIL